MKSLTIAAFISTICALLGIVTKYLRTSRIWSLLLPAKALAQNYFLEGGCPVMAVRVTSGDGQAGSHEHDLTEIEHDHDFNELVIITRGRAMQRLEGFDYPVATGDVYLLQSEHKHYFYDRDDLEMINVMYDLRRADLPLGELRRIPGFSALFVLEPQYRRKHRFQSRLHLGPVALNQAQQIAMQILQEVTERRPGHHVAVKAKLLELMIFVSRQYGQTETTEAQSLLRVGDVIRTLEEQYDQAWTIDALAAIAHMSPSHLVRVFRKATGHTPVDYLLRLRVGQAMEALKTTTDSITRIAFNVGFEDSNYFARQFRRYTGQSPTQYRRAQARA